MPSLFAISLNHAAALLLLGAGLLTGSPAHAQKTPPAMPLLDSKTGNSAYAGPRFPGGPDSLRALLNRAQRQASPALAGQLFLRVELAATGKATKYYFLTPPNPADLALSRTSAAQELAQRLASQLPAWQLPAPDSDKSSPANQSVTLPLVLGAATAPVPLLYSDEHPTFPVKISKHNGIGFKLTASAMRFLMTQIRYPVADLRSRTQGTVYAYFEVSETGAIEQRRVAGSISPTLDAEVLRVIHLLPNALTPPHYQGQPVRVAYVMPFKFMVQ